MKMKYGGKYTGEEQLVRKPDPEGSVMFREPENMKKFAVVMNLIAVAVAVAAFVACYLRNNSFRLSYVGAILMLLSMVPHEFLHAIWFRGEVTMYTNLSKFMLFVYGTEDMSKARFILLSLCPNIIFGLIPFIVYMIYPASAALGTFAAFSLSAGGGDYLNVFNAATQVPRGATVYNNGMHTYWYKQN